MTLAYSALHLLKMVREGRLELPRVTPLEPKSSASTNSATLALIQARHYSRSQPASALSCRKYCAPYCDLASAKKRVGEKWGGRWDLNPRPQESQSCALPTELRPPLNFQHGRSPWPCTASYNTTNREWHARQDSNLLPSA